MPKPFKIYRIINALTDKALVSGSDHALWGGQRPGRVLQWHERGTWALSGGSFWKTEASVRKHLQNLCHDWVNRNASARWPSYPGQCDWWPEVVPGSAD